MDQMLEQVEPQWLDLDGRAPATECVVMAAGPRICSGIRALDALGQGQRDEQPDDGRPPTTPKGHPWMVHGRSTEQPPSKQDTPTSAAVAASSATQIMQEL